MRTAILVVAAVAAALGLPAAEADEIEDLRKRVEKLEEASGDPSDRVAQTQASADKNAWASKISFKGDLRYRQENIDAEEAATDRTRHRLRARFGLTVGVNDTVSATLRLATGGGGDDPRSTNQTLGEGFDRKDLAIDQAYVEWTPVTGFSVLAGKMPQPWETVGSHLWDGDITPEGGALKFEHGAFFGAAFGFWLSESGSGSDATLSGGQLGLKSEVGGAKLMAAIGYYDVGAVRNKITTAAAACTPNGAFFGGPQGNSTVTAGGCARLLSDFNIFEAVAQAQLKLGGQPLTFFIDYLQNQEADDLDTAYSAGLKWGAAKDPRTWEFGYVYQMAEKDSQFGQFIDSDFGGGITDVQGSAFKVAYAPAKNWTLNGAYFLNERFIDVGTERDYDRVQFDVNFKF